MLGIDESRYAPALLSLGDGMEGESGLTGRLGTENLS